MEPHFKWKLLLLGLLIVALTSRLGYLQLTFEEPRRSEVSLEMMINGNYIVPTINDTYYYNKPPLYNWLMLGIFKSFSTTEEWSVRILTVLSFLLIGLLIFISVNKYINKKTAWIAAFFLLTTGDILYRFSLSGEIDVFYTLIVFLQTLSIFHFYKQKNYYLLFIVSYLFCSAGFLTKGLTSPAFQVFTLIAWAFLFRKTRYLFSLQHLAGIAVFFLLVGGYFVAYSRFNDPTGFIVNLIAESTQRTNTGGDFLELLAGWVLFPWMFITILFPWVIVLAFISKRSIKELWQNDFIRFSLVFIISNLILYWISPGTRPRYLYPFIPFSMILLASLFTLRYNQSAVSYYLDKFFIGITGLLGAGFLISPLFELPEAIPNPWIMSVIFVIVFGFLFIMQLKSKAKIWIFFAVMIILRFAFNYIVLPVRKAENSEKEPYKYIVKDMIDRTEGEKIWLMAPVQMTILDPSFLGIPFPESTINTIPWPSYQISFYLAGETGKVLSWDDSRDLSRIYFANKLYLEDENIEILSSYTIPDKDREYILFKYLP